MQDARQVSLALDEIAGLLEFAEASRFKVNAYRRAAEIVNTLGDELGPLVEQNRLDELEGIGSTLSRQIEELWNSGTSGVLSRLQSELPEGAAELMQVPGLTPRRIRALQAAIGIRSAEELRAACEAGRVRGVPGFGEKTEAKLRASVERWLTRDQTTPEPMLLARALELAALLEKRLLGAAERVALTGELRRGLETVRKIEFVIAGDLEAALSRVAGLRQVLRVDVPGARAFLTEGVVLELHAAQASNFGSVLFRTTGDEAHVAAITPAPGVFASEAELYRSAGCFEIPPELRSGRAALERAREDDFSDLVTLDDLQGMVHCHTTYSDGKNSVTEMALAAHALGMKYITITDHSPAAHYARGVTLDRLKEQWDEIARVSEEVPIRILRGTESDILADGQLDFPDSILEQFDVVIASIHARHRLDRAAMTARLERVLALPVFKIWGHALGRILNHRAPIDCDVLRVLDALAGSRGAVEINADPHRLDLAPEWIPEARARRIPFVISADAHSTKGMGVLRYGVTMARRGGVRKREVLNTESAETFSKVVKP
ncbi:MAG TPA: PHP domain-containing protein [Polyangiaceae bacterium]